MAQYAREHPGWTGVYVEFWTHASRRSELRAKVAEQHERLVETVGGMVATWAGRWGVELALPAREVVRGIYAISRGLGLETLLADESRALDQFEERFLAYVTGLIRTRPGAAAPAEGGSHDLDHLVAIHFDPGARPRRARPTGCGRWPPSSWPGRVGLATGCSTTRASGWRP